MGSDEAFPNGLQYVLIASLGPEGSLTDNVVAEVLFGVFGGHIAAVTVENGQIYVLELIVAIELILEVVVVFHVFAAALATAGVHPEPDGHRPAAGGQWLATGGGSGRTAEAVTSI